LDISNTLIIFIVSNINTNNMKTLVIHPKDETTTFLDSIYKGIENKTVVQEGCTPEEIIELIKTHDRVIMLGHGTPRGLLSMGRFPNCGHVINKNMVKELSKKTDNVYIWCHADEFVKEHKLKGFYSGMFVSEVDEAFYERINDATQKVVTESNNEFGRILGEVINEKTVDIFDYVTSVYGEMAESNKVARYNHKRLYMS